jgi:hypothetical protein
VARDQERTIELPRWQTASFGDLYKEEQLRQVWPGPLDIYDPSETGVHLLAARLAQPKIRATGVHLYKLQRDHLLRVLEAAEARANRSQRASATAKVRYLMKVRGCKSTAKQFLKFETIPGVQKRDLANALGKTIDDADLTKEQKDFFQKRLFVVMSAEQTYHLRGRTHRRCAKSFDVTRVPQTGTFSAWKARKSDEVTLIDKSLDVPRIVSQAEISKSYRAQVSKFAFALQLPQVVKNEMMRVVSSIVFHSAQLVHTPEAEKYVEAFEQLEERQILVGLDRNPKAAAVMTEGMYRAGMQDTYAKDTAHYTVITDEKEAKAAIERAEQKIWAALPRWIRRKLLTIGYEYLNLKEK